MTISSVNLVALLLLFIAVPPVRSLNVLSQRVDVPIPDGSGVVFVQLQADPSDPNFNLLTGFNITATNFINAEQALRLWNSAEGNCQGSFISIASPASQVPKDGMLCFFSNTSTGPLEFENSFSFVALGDSISGNVGSVTFLNYNKQLCTGIPDLGSPSSITLPPEPTVNIRLAGLEIHFTVTATYLRNQTTWFLDFWNFNSAAGGDSINGAASTCTNQVAANHQGSFSSWWYSAPRATYNHGVDASIEDALDDVIYPNYDPSGSRWSITAIDCSTVQYQTTIPVSNLVMNSTSDCHKTGSIVSAATTTGGLQYFGTLYANALRPIDSSSASAGYFRSTFAFPFSFSLQTTVSSIVGTSSKWNFVVSVLDSLVTFDGETPNFMLQLQTSISSPSATSPNVDASGFQIIAMPLSTLHTASFAPTLSRLVDNGQCGVGSSQACIITWQMVVPQLPQGDFSNMVDFDTQYVGKYSFQWTTASGRRDVRAGDVLQADIYVDVSAANPATNLSQVPINSSLSFYSDRASMQTTSDAGMAVPQYNSGEPIWVRHSFLVDPQDTQAFIFNLTHAYICTSNVPGFVPSVANGQTGCSQDIPGVMELSQGQRFVLFDVDTLPGGIADINGNASAGQHDTIWGWQQILPSDPSWTGASTVNNGFSINALPLAQENSQTTWYFHLISQVSQTPLTRRGANNNNNNRRGSNIVQHILRAPSTRSSPESPALQGVTIAAASSSSSDANSIASSSLFAHLKDALLW